MLEKKTVGMLQRFSYIQPVTQCHQLLLECIDDSLSSLAAIGNFNCVGRTGRYVDHVLKRRVFEGLDWL
jgi:hypothetical protein